MKWKPIETAPSNDFQGNVLIVGGAWPEPTIVKNDGDWWRYRLREGGKGQPTHWMHLPPLPDEQKHAVDHQLGHENSIRAIGRLLRLCDDNGLGDKARELMEGIDNG